MLQNINADLHRLLLILDELREKCPWDKKQTIHTLRQQTIEETFELVDAITDQDWQGIKEELGDVLLHIIFYAKMGQEQQKFTLQEVIDGICEKLIARHPHIYGNPANLVKVNSDEDVKRNWEQIKLKEASRHAKEGESPSLLSGVPRALPAMVKAMRLQEKAKQVGFEWDNKEQVWEKIEEEEQELLEAVHSGNQEAIAEEMGDLFFSIINYARYLNVDAENALELTNKKFIKRFNGMEALVKAKGKDLHDLSLEEMDMIWNTVKQQRKPS